jgi:hypothetical protein
MTHHIIAAEILWDNQDHSNVGWAYRLRFANGREESGEYNGFPDCMPTEDALRNALVHLCLDHGLHLDTDDINIDFGITRASFK